MRSLAFAATVLVAAAAAGADYEEIEVKDGGTIAGKITYNGTPPEAKMIPITKDPEVCGKTRLEDTWMVAPGGGVANVVVYLQDVPRGKKMVGDIKPVLDQKGCHYVPHVGVVRADSDLQVKSSDPILHNVHSYLEGATVINFAIPPVKGFTLSKHLDTSGGQQLKCDIHNFMKGALFVADNPYFAITAADGGYQITDVPPGKYTIATWHEAGGPITASITVAAKEKVTWNAKVR